MTTMNNLRSKNTYEEFMANETERKKKLFKSLTPTQKHMTLMFLLRIQTDPENARTAYVEAKHFESYNFWLGDIPDLFFRLSPEELRAEAYEALGVRYKEGA